jgi:alpha-L-fucosidase 2
LALGVGLAAARAELVLWYQRPADTTQRHPTNGWSNSRGWVEALPVGNGRLGAMIYGGVGDERLQLNEDSVWSGRPQDADNPDALQHLPEIRRLLFEGRYADAQKLTYEKLVCRGPGTCGGAAATCDFGCYQTLGDLELHFEGAGPVVEYRRELDLETAVARVAYRRNGVVRAGDLRQRRRPRPGDPIDGRPTRDAVVHRGPVEVGGGGDENGRSR